MADLFLDSFVESQKPQGIKKTQGMTRYELCIDPMQIATSVPTVDDHDPSESIFLLSEFSLKIPVEDTSPTLLKR